MTTKPQTLSLALTARTREPAARRQPRPEYHVPRVRKDEVEIAGQILASYEGLAEHVDELTAFGLTSRNNAYALVQLGWAFATVEKDHFEDRRWFFDSWMPTMKSAQTEGEEMNAETEQGKRIRLNRAERNVLIRCLGPMFGSGLNDELVDTVSAAIIGKRGTHIEMSLEVLRVANGLESIDEVIKVVKAEAAASPAPEADAIDESDEDAPEADAEETEAPAAEEPAAQSA